MLSVVYILDSAAETRRQYTREWMNEMMLQADVVLMPVPLRFAPQVADYVSALVSGRTETLPTPALGGDTTDRVSVPQPGRVDAEMLARLGRRHAVYRSRRTV